MVVNNRIKLLLDGCDFWGMDNDCFNMGMNGSHVVAQKDPRMLKIEDDRGDYRSGETLAIWNWVAKKERTRATVRAARSNDSDDTWELPLDQDVVIVKTGQNSLNHLHSDDAPGVKSEKTLMAARAARHANETDGIDRVINMSDVGTVTIRNSRFQRYRARNLMIKASDSLVEHNEFYGTTMASIIVGPEFYWDEGPAVSNLVIRNNQFTNISDSNTVVESRTSNELYDLRHITISGKNCMGYGHFAEGITGKRGVFVYARNTDGLEIGDNYAGPADEAAPKAPHVVAEVSENLAESWRNEPVPHAGVNR